MDTQSKQFPYPAVESKNTSQWTRILNSQTKSELKEICLWMAISASKDWLTNARFHLILYFYGKAFNISTVSRSHECQFSKLSQLNIYFSVLGTLKTTDVHLKHLKAHSINGRNISHLYQNAISNTGNFTLLQPKFFSSLSVSKLDLNGLINQINLTTLESNSMKLAGDQVVTGRRLH